MAALAPVWRHLGLRTQSPSVLHTLHQAETYAPGRIPILILGDTGTGKDLLAQGIHTLSEQPGRYVPVNCAAARSELFVAELFGARRGAYTGAVEDRRGLVEEAAQGTLFFDEIADLDAEAQGYLLRFLDSGEIRPVGDTRSRVIETRILAATCRNLGALVGGGLFRADLYERLAGTILEIPPLQERMEDLPILIAMLWERGGGDPELSEEVFNDQIMGELRHRPWRGNVRELKHVVDRAILFHRRHGGTAARADLIAQTNKARAADSKGRSGASGTGDATGHGTPRSRSRSRKRQRQQDQDTLQAPQGEWDPDLLKQALDAAGGVITEAARLLGVSRAQAYRLYKQLREKEAPDPGDSPDAPSQAPLPEGPISDPPQS